MENRIKTIRILLAREKLDALFVSSAVNISYITGFDGFGIYEREGYALITATNVYILADPRLAESARKNSQSCTVVELTAQKKLVHALKDIFCEEKVQIIGFEVNLTFAELKKFKKTGGKWKLTDGIIEEVRVVKDINELNSLKKACKLTDDAFSHALKQIRAGMTELELAWVIEQYIREHGGILAFPSIVAFGKNSAIPHHKTGDGKIVKNSIILLDFGACIDGYSADMTRTIFFGNADEKFTQMYNATLSGQLAGFNVSQKQITAEKIDKQVRFYITEKGFPSVPHSIGHGVGLEVHELPHISPEFEDILQPNTPFTIEPGIYINGYGGVRIEDTVLYDGEKIESLTKSKKELIEL